MNNGSIAPVSQSTQSLERSFELHLPEEVAFQPAQVAKPRNAIVPFIKGGFKHEVQHGITIDETPLQAS
jgi:hypothetical protein